MWFIYYIVKRFIATIASNDISFWSVSHKSLSLLLPLLFFHGVSPSLLCYKKVVAIYSIWIMRVWLPLFSLRLTELTSGLFGRLSAIGLVGKPLQCCSRCRQGRPSTHRWRHTHTHIQCTHNIRNIHIFVCTLMLCTLHTWERLCIHAHTCKHKYRCARS